jgi:hypothetical protein
VSVHSALVGFDVTIEVQPRKLKSQGAKCVLEHTSRRGVIMRCETTATTEATSLRGALAVAWLLDSLAKASSAVGDLQVEQHRGLTADRFAAAVALPQ